MDWDTELVAKGWTLHANDDGLREYRGPHEMSVFVPAHGEFANYFRAYWEKINSHRVYSPLESAWLCYNQGTWLQPKPKGYIHGLPKL